jgi:acyl carrier protein
MAEASEYVGRIIEIASDIFGVDKSTLTEESTWEEGLGIDVKNSLQDRNYADFVSALNDEYSIDIPYIKFGRTKNFAEMAQMVADLADD